MAVELEHFLTEQLARLPEDHPDRPFLAGQLAVVDAFVERTDPALLVEDGAVMPVGPVAETVYQGAQEHEPATQPRPAAIEQDKQERVNLKGRIGARPRFSDTPRGVRRAEFNLAVHQDDESTTWHTVLAFRQRAEQLEQANPQKGQYAEVVGYKHVEERTDREGKPKTVERIIAAHIKLR